MTSAADLPLRGLLLALLALVQACAPGPETRYIEGATMGTRYHITWLDGAERHSPEFVQSGVESVLAGIIATLSTYESGSEISRFNRLPVGESHRAGQELLDVFRLARQVSEASDGAYDVTVAPLVDLWGFGPQRRSSVPSDEEISLAQGQVGEQFVSLAADGTLIKQRELSLDFSSIAKGYAVDRVAGWMSRHGIEDYLVEIGGEIRVSGERPLGGSWRIAVERPEALQRAVAAVLHLDAVAVATSGDYRNYFEVDGVRYSHTIDPRTGRPVRHQLVSVTVVHPEAALADAWATALVTLGTERARVVAAREGLAVYLISRDGDTFEEYKSAEIEAYLR